MCSPSGDGDDVWIAVTAVPEDLHRVDGLWPSPHDEVGVLDRLAQGQVWQPRGAAGEYELSVEHARTLQFLGYEPS